MGVEHPQRKKSRQRPVPETSRNDRIVGLRFRRGERHVDGFAQTLRGQAVRTGFGDDVLRELPFRLPIPGLLELTQIFFSRLSHIDLFTAPGLTITRSMPNHISSRRSASDIPSRPHLEEL